jgi:dihydrofolate reductase
MGRIVVTELVSLDGVIEAPGGGEDYRHAGWTFEIDRGPEGDRFKLEELREAQAQLLGRVTYEGFAAAWPSMTDDAGFADKMNAMPKYVVSSTLEQAQWSNSTVLRGDVAEEVRKLKEQRLFGPTSDKLALRLADARTVGDGIAMLTYERDR